MDILAYRTIGTPREAHGVDTVEKYFALANSIRSKGMSVLPTRTWLPFRDVLHAVPEINCGRWIVRCECGNCPSASPEWDLAICLECFAVYKDIEFPEDYRDLETILMERPKMLNRNWFPIETAADLLTQNIANGVE